MTSSIHQTRWLKEPSVTTNRTLVIVAHPNLAKSRANAAWLAEIEGLDNVTIHDLYKNYSDLTLDAKREQQLLREHDTVIFQFPLHWYSVTPLLKAWFDAVLTHGFAFAFDGTVSALKGKKAWLAVTVGSRLADYTAEGPARRPLDEYLVPVAQSLEFCSLDYQGVHGFYGMIFNPSEEDLALSAKEYARLIATNETPANANVARLGVVHVRETV